VLGRLLTTVLVAHGDSSVEDGMDERSLHGRRCDVPGGHAVDAAVAVEQFVDELLQRGLADVNQADVVVLPIAEILEGKSGTRIVS